MKSNRLETRKNRYSENPEDNLAIKRLGLFCNIYFESDFRVKIEREVFLFLGKTNWVRRTWDEEELKWSKSRTAVCLLSLLSA